MMYVLAFVLGVVATIGFGLVLENDKFSHRIIVLRLSPEDHRNALKLMSQHEPSVDIYQLFKRALTIYDWLFYSTKDEAVVEVNRDYLNEAGPSSSH